MSLYFVVLPAAAYTLGIALGWSLAKWSSR
jgi:hypothetical protein